MKRIYKVPLPETSAEGDRDQLQAVLSEVSALDGDSIVESLSTEAGEARLQGRYQYGPTYAEQLAKELEGLANASIDGLPMFRQGKESKIAGYYEINSAETSPAHPTDHSIYEWELEVKAVGTRASHWVAVTTNLSQDFENPFADGSVGLVGIPADAEKVRAVDKRISPVQTEKWLEPSDTVTTENGDVDLYSPSVLAFDPIYLYDLPYADQGPRDVDVWDTHDRDRLDRDSGVGTTVGSATVGSATVSGAATISSWERVFSTSHDFGGRVVFENGVVWLGVDEDERRLLARRWDDDEQRWRLVSLETRGWRVFDVDIRRITKYEVEAVFEFIDEDAGNVEELRMSLQRGWESPLWINPDSGTTIDQGLLDWLDPIASGAESHPQPGSHLIAHDNVN